MSDVYEFLDSRSAVGARLKLLRKATGLSQAAAARRIGVTLTVWNNWERGLSSPKIPGMLQIARAFGVTTDWILCGKTDGLTVSMSQRLEVAAQAAGEMGDTTTWLGLRRA